MNRVVLVLIGVVLLGIAGFATLWFRVGGQLQERAEAVLVAWRDGATRAVYDEASPAFREGRSYEQFRAYLDHWAAAFGAFREVASRTYVSTGSRNGVTRKEVTLAITCERGELLGQFLFRSGAEDLQLAHLSLREREAAAPWADRNGLDGIAGELFALYDARAYVALYAKLAASLQQAWPPARLRAQLDALHESGGRIATGFSRTALRTEGQGDKAITHVDFALTFERAAGTARVDYRWDDERWHVVGLTLKTSR